MKTVLQRLKDGVLSESLSIKEAAVILHKQGFTNFIDIDLTKRLLNMN